MLDILLVDDEPEIRLPLGEALREIGHHVSLAADGYARCSASIVRPSIWS
jgi:CheY-like chemotaxis protein